MKKVLTLSGLSFFLILLAFSQTSKEMTKLESFNLTDVKILYGPFFKAQQADMLYILQLDADRLLAPYLKDAGIKPLKDNYGNWENIGLDGHTAGHYLSALAFMYAATGNEELLRRINYMVEWLDTCQKKNGDGYVGGVPDGHALWKEIAAGKVDAGGFSLSNRWVPLYNLHKLYAGLRDIYLVTENKKALKELVKLTDWFYNLTKNLSDAQIQDILKTEHGGLNEVFAQVAEFTGDKKYLDLAIRVSHKAILEPLIQQKNELTGLHANTQIPKVIGFKTIADATNNTSWDLASEFFWNTVIDKWTVSIGGNSVREHFNPMDNYTSMIESNQGPETCNTYNMLRLTKLLYLTDPKSKYIDYYERALFNHILSSEQPAKGGFVYFTPMRPRHYRVYSQPQSCFWCCVGTGLENHAKYGEIIYVHDENNLYVNLFIASKVTWKDRGVTLMQYTKFPDENFTEFKVNLDKSAKFTLKIRKPSWVKTGGFKVYINEVEQTLPEESGYYVTIDRKWESGDRIKVTLPMQTKVEYLPDGSNWASIIQGPIVLAAISDSSNLTGLWADDSRMGHVPNGPLYPINESPAIVTNQKDFTSLITPVKDKPMTFTMSGLIYPDSLKNIELVPFYKIHEARYIIYWPVFDSAGLAKNRQKSNSSENELLKLEGRTIDQIAPGEQQPEADHNFKSENSISGINQNKHWREATGWFSYEMNNTNKQGSILRVTYYGLDRDRIFDILINGNKLTTMELQGLKGDVFYDVDYNIPDNFLNQSNGNIMTVKFVAVPNSKAGGVYYIRLLK